MMMTKIEQPKKVAPALNIALKERSLPSFYYIYHFDMVFNIFVQRQKKNLNKKAI